MKKIIKQEQWVMLPTKDKSQIQYRDSDNKLLFYHNGVADNETVHLNPQHLYLTYDEEIKEGDWVICKVNKSTFIRKAIFVRGHLDNHGLGYHSDKGMVGVLFTKDDKKIIATTDKSLTLESKAKKLSPIEAKRSGWEDYQLPQIPESFVKYFVEKQGEVGDVSIELEKDNYWFNARIIIPKEEEKMYSKDEVTQMLVDYSNDLMNMKLRGNVADSVNKWIKENL